MPSGTKKFNLKHNNKYISLYRPIYKNKSPILLVCSKKGIGKTIEMIRWSQIEYQNNLKPSILIKTTGKQADIFSDKINEAYNILGIKLNNRYSIYKSGVYRTMQGNKKLTKKGRKPLIEFIELNQASNYQGATFANLAFGILDDIQDHFGKFSNAPFDRNLSSLISNILRTRSLIKLVALFNPIDPNDVMLRFFRLRKQFENQPWGTIRNYQIKLPYSNTNKMLKVAIYKALPTKNLKKEQEESLSGQIANLSSYSRITSGQDWLMPLNPLKYITKLGDFKAIININGNRFGIWFKEEKEQFLIQLSRKFNKTGKEYYFSFDDYNYQMQSGNKEFFENLRNLFHANVVEIDDYQIFKWIQKYIK